MSIHPFTSESYSEDDRLVAWQEVLSGVGLRFELLPGAPQGHAMSLQRSAEGVVVARLVAGPQLLFPSRSVADRPILIVPLSDGCTIKGLKGFVIALLLGYVLNCAVCASLATLANRFGSRESWLIVFAAIVVVMEVVSRRKTINT